MKVPEYVLTIDHSITIDRHDIKVIPAGTFAKPIEYHYVPKHIVDDNRWKSFNKKTEVFCYTRYGIYPMPRDILRTV